MSGGGRLPSFRCGDRSEQLAEFLLSAIAFTTRVPRQEDVGYDFFCSLIKGDDKLLKAGPFFTVQAKSSRKPVIYKKDYEIDWITNQENPLLLCVVDQGELAMDIYSTWNLLGHLYRKASQIKLLPDKSVEPWPGVEYKRDGTQKIGLGPPIARISAKQVFDNDYIARVKKVIGEWVALDRENIVNRHAGMYWMVGPEKYQTGQPLYANAPMRLIFYHHPGNLRKCELNLGRSAAAVAILIRDLDPSWFDQKKALQDIVRSFWDRFDDSVRDVLTRERLKPSG